MIKKTAMKTNEDDGGNEFWQRSGHRGEWSCPHGVGHGNHVHGCCGEGCCSRDDFPKVNSYGQPWPKDEE